MSTPPVQLTRHCRELSPDELAELVTAVADLIVGYLQAAEPVPLTGGDSAQNERSGRESQLESNRRGTVP